MTIRALIVDDEPLAREGIRTFLADQHDVEIIGECSSGDEAVATIRSMAPDLVFLDIQMPELDGFDVLRTLDLDETPAVVFITAHDEYAMEAFRVFALDYLLKPIEKSRFDVAIERVRRHLNVDGLTGLRERIFHLLRDLDQREDYLDRIVVKSRGRVSLVSVRDIHWIEAAGNYARLHMDKDDHLVRETMSSLEQRLNPRHFARVHRSAIVNLDRIREIQPWFKGDLMVILESGQQVALSRKYRKILQGRLGQSL